MHIHLPQVEKSKRHLHTHLDFLLIYLRESLRHLLSPIGPNDQRYFPALNYPTRPGRIGIPMGCPTSLVQLMSIPQGKHTCPGWHMERFPCGVMSDIPVHPVPCQSIQLSRTERLVSISESFLSYLYRTWLSNIRLIVTCKVIPRLHF